MTKGNVIKMQCKIKIRELAVYHPSNQVNNEYYIEHFKKQGKDVSTFMTKVLGRESRYEINNEGKEKSQRENSLTMQIQASKLVLEKSNLTGNDIDGIIVATQFPEYMVPPSYMRIHAEINAKRECFGYDINANCLGMTMAFQQANQYFVCNDNINRILIVGGDYLTGGVSDEDESLYGVFGEASCAIVVERTEGDSMLIDKDYFINNISVDGTFFPRNGFSEIMDNGNIDILSIQTEKPECDLPVVIDKMRNLIRRNNLRIEDIGGFCFSQYVKANNNKIIEALKIAPEKCPYVGNVYGYTGGCSPFLALNSLIEGKMIKRGDYIMFWTIGAAMQHIFILIKY